MFFKKLELELDKKRVEYIKDYRHVGVYQSTYRIVRRKKKNTGIVQMSAVMSNAFFAAGKDMIEDSESAEAATTTF